MKMTVEHIRDTINQMRDCVGDYEAAHSIEDKLYQDFIEYVASLRRLGVSELAKEVLKSSNVAFPRYCA